jgi:transposase
LDKARKGEKVVLFMDAAHFIFATFLGYIWCRTRYFLKSHAGRKRYNVLGALNAVSKKVSIYTNDTTLGALSVCAFLKQVFLEYYGKQIVIVLDNASYQRCKLVRRYARILGIELLFLPSYSPNLNLIERFWKYVKKEVLYSTFHNNYAIFKQQIDDCIQNAFIKDKEKLESLLTYKFQSFKKVKLLPA